jgi:hypothetical protein
MHTKRILKSWKMLKMLTTFIIVKLILRWKFLITFSNIIGLLLKSFIHIPQWKLSWGRKSKCCLLVKAVDWYNSIENDKKDVTLAKHNWHLSKKASSHFRSIFFHQQVIANLMNFSFEYPLFLLVRCVTQPKNLNYLTINYFCVVGSSRQINIL